MLHMAHLLYIITKKSTIGLHSILMPSMNKRDGNMNDVKMLHKSDAILFTRCIKVKRLKIQPLSFLVMFQWKVVTCWLPLLLPPLVLCPHHLFSWTYPCHCKIQTACNITFCKSKETKQVKSYKNIY